MRKENYQAIFFRKKRLRIILKTYRQINLIRFKAWNNIKYLSFVCVIFQGPRARHEEDDRRVERAGRGHRHHGHAAPRPPQRARQRHAQTSRADLLRVRLEDGGQGGRVGRRQVPPGHVDGARQPRHQQQDDHGCRGQPLALGGGQSARRWQGQVRAVLPQRPQGRQGLCMSFLC